MTGTTGTSPNFTVQLSAVPHCTSAALKRSLSRHGLMQSWSVSVFSVVSQSLYGAIDGAAGSRF